MLEPFSLCRNSYWVMSSDLVLHKQFACLFLGAHQLTSPPSQSESLLAMFDPLSSHEGKLVKWAFWLLQKNRAKTLCWCLFGSVVSRLQTFFPLCSRGFCRGKAKGSLCPAIASTTRSPNPGRSCGRKWGQVAKLRFPCFNSSWNGGLQAKAFLPWEISSQQELWYSIICPATYEWPQLEPASREWRARAPSSRSHWCYFFGGCTSFIIFIPE